MKSSSKYKGFTLIELLVVISIISLLASVVLASLSTARRKGEDAATKSQLSSMRAAAELYYNTNNTFSGVCQSTNGIAGMVDQAQQDSGAVSSDVESAVAVPTTIGALDHVTCHDTSTNSAWVADAPIKSGGMWCVDSRGASRAEPTFMTAAETFCP